MIPVSSTKSLVAELNQSNPLSFALEPSTQNEKLTVPLLSRIFSYAAKSPEKLLELGSMNARSYEVVSRHSLSWSGLLETCPEKCLGILIHFSDHEVQEAENLPLLDLCLGASRLEGNTNNCLLNLTTLEKHKDQISLRVAMIKTQSLYDLTFKVIGGINPNSKNPQGISILYEAALNEDEAAFNRLVKAGANLNEKNIYGFPILLMAAEYKNSTAFNRLVKAGANLNEKSIHGFPILLAAARDQNSTIFDRLVKAGANLNEKDINGFPIVLTATTYQNSTAFDRLVEAGADIIGRDKSDKKDELEFPNLFSAASSSNPRSFNRLEEVSADSANEIKSNIDRLEALMANPIAAKLHFGQTPSDIQILNLAVLKNFCKESLRKEAECYRRLCSSTKEIQSLNILSKM